MSFHELQGIWTYRSFRNLPEIVQDFNKLTVWEAELYLDSDEESNSIYGHLGERAEEAKGNEPFLYIKGEFADSNPMSVNWRATGKPGTEYEGWIYDYAAFLNPIWQDGKGRGSRPTLVGTVTRTVAHGEAPAGSVFSFIAVKRDFVEPRDCIPLEKMVTDMLASPEHRLHHQLWHASRDQWSTLSESKKDALREINWQPGSKMKERSSSGPDMYSDGSGEDFLFMHRQMIAHVRSMQSITSWRILPDRLALASFDVGFKASQVGNPDGFALPDAWIIEGDPRTTHWLHDLRRNSTFYARFRFWEAQYTDPTYLSRVTLGELGARIEWTIHNWMHMRWTSITRDPDDGTPLPKGRDALDFNEKWFKPNYDFLGETFSSHVNPIFWRLHGWVDDRIEDWYRAQEAAHPGEVIRRDLEGIKWFAPGKWVVLDEPWAGPISHQHSSSSPQNGHHNGLNLDPEVMKEALHIIFGPEPSSISPISQVSPQIQWQKVRATWFKMMAE